MRQKGRGEAHAVRRMKEPWLDPEAGVAATRSNATMALYADVRPVAPGLPASSCQRRLDGGSRSLSNFDDDDKFRDGSPVSILAAVTICPAAAVTFAASSLNSPRSGISFVIRPPLTLMKSLSPFGPWVMRSAVSARVGHQSCKLLDIRHGPPSRLYVRYRPRGSLRQGSGAVGDGRPARVVRDGCLAQGISLRGDRPPKDLADASLRRCAPCHEEAETQMTARMMRTVPELKRITELANEYRQQLVADLAPEFPGLEAHALAAALSIMFATSMTPDPAQQSDQARILNEIMSRWQPVLPWQMVKLSN